MSTAHDTMLYLEDVQEAIETILGYVQGIEEEEFRGRQMLQDTVVHQLEIIGGATEHRYGEIREQNPRVPWKVIAGT